MNDTEKKIDEIWVIRFERVGRRRDVPDLTITVPARDYDDAAHHLAGKVHAYVKRYLASHYYDVEINLEEGTGRVSTAVRVIGRFALTRQDPS